MRYGLEVIATCFVDLAAQTVNVAYNVASVERTAVGVCRVTFTQPVPLFAGQVGGCSYPGDGFLLVNPLSDSVIEVTSLNIAGAPADRVFGMMFVRTPVQTGLPAFINSGP